MHWRTIRFGGFTMIREVLFDVSPIQAGEQRSLQAWADTPLSVEIKCFTSIPPPPGYKGCPSCGVIEIESGEKTYVTADRRTFERASGGQLDVTLKDQTGDRREYQLKVIARERGSSFQSGMGA
jgi:hypothetical protein